MKKLFSLMVFIPMTFFVFAQAPEKMSYQCVVRNSSGSLVTNQSVGVRITILQGSPSGTMVYQETFSPNPVTNSNGLLTLEIGGGVSVTGIFSTIDWGSGAYFLRTESDPSGGTNYNITETSQLLSVPYALHAKSTENGFSGNYNDLSNKPPLAIVATSGSYNDLTNKPTISVSTDLTLEGNGTSSLPLKIARQSASTGQVLKWNGIEWNPSEDLTGGLSLPFLGSTDAQYGFRVISSSSLENSFAIGGSSTSSSGIVAGINGSSASTTGIGVAGNAAASYGVNHGVYGLSKSSSGRGVFGLADASTGSTYGVYGLSYSDDGYGVYGESPLMGIYGVGTGLDAKGVMGRAVSEKGTGVSGFGGRTGLKGEANNSQGDSYGVYGSASSPSGYGVYGQGNYYGVGGVASNTTGKVYGVYGWSLSPDGYSGYFKGGSFYVSGNVGINTEIPSSALEVNGQLKITGGSPGAGKILTSDAGGLASWQPSTSFISPGGLTGSIQFNSSGYFGGNDNFFWDVTNKRLGLGTRSPTRDISINGGDKNDASINFQTNSTGATWYDGMFLGLGNTQDGWAGEMWCYENYPLIFGTNNSWKMMITGNGNVGIGSYNPPYKLDVIGDRIRISNNAGNAWLAMRTDGSAGFLDLSYSGGKLAIQGTNAGENVLLNPGINSFVGVRTWNPQYELDVTGNIRATGSVYYGGSAGSANGAAYNKPDFVFGDDYELLNTEQVEDFLRREKHLPWITSAEQEKKENGAVTDMTRMAFETLEAVENLQLQIIDQGQLIKELKNENDLLKARLEKIEILLGVRSRN